MSAEGIVYDVIIVGCGPAGIAAAIDFQTTRPATKFLLLEARDRVGGRVATDTDTFGVDTPVDLGAQWIHNYGPENPLHAYHRSSLANQIEEEFEIRSSTSVFFDMDGSRISSEALSEAEKIFDEQSDRIKESAAASDRSILDLIQKDPSDSQQKRLVDLLFGLVEQYEASNLDELSARSFMNSKIEMAERNMGMPNGFGSLIEQVVRQHQLSVEFNAIVTRIDVSSSDSTVRLSTDDQRVFFSRYVLVAVPLGCLKARSIQFTPPLPEWKQTAIDRMGFGLLNKIFLQFPSVFWDPQWTSFYCVLPRLRFVVCRPRDRILLIMASGRTAVEIEQQPEQQIIAEVMRSLRSIFSDRHVPDPSRFLITKWQQDPFARGSYSNFSVGTDRDTLVDLARECHERIYWAGEHTNYDGSIGCVDSAFESGQREAKRIGQRLEVEEDVVCE